ncbi:MAG: hypothetical protein OEZ06_27135 [Myxococcales bacterium]|nr:hypothetical protein [Myxococcales bacterium]
MMTRLRNEGRRTLAAPGVALWLVAMAFGCAHGGAGLTPSIDELRARAKAAPGDGVAQRQLLLAELFSHAGDRAAVDAQLERALSVGGADPRLHWAAAVHHDTHGHPAKALDAYLKVLTSATKSADPIAPQLAEFAAHAIGGIQGGVPGYDERVRPVLNELFDARALPLPVHFQVGQVLIRFAQLDGDAARVEALAQKLGCVTQMRTAGPFGQRQLLSFDDDHGLDPARPLSESYDLGHGRGRRPTRELGARGCAVPLGGGAIGEGGTRFAQAELKVTKSGRHRLRVESPNSTEVYLDGKRVGRIDRRRELGQAVVFLPLSLSAGSHLLTVKVSSRHPGPAVALSLHPEREGDAAALRLPYDEHTPHGFPRYLRAGLAMLRGDVLTARQSLSGVERAERVAPLLSMQRATLFLNDPLYPADQRSDEARRLHARALREDSQLWNPAVQLASMAAENGRTKEAIAALREAVERWPEVPAVSLTLLQLLRGQDWDAEADQVLERVRKLVPDACGPMQAEMQALRSRQREEAAAALVEPIMACNAQSNARYGLLLQQRKWEQAQAELDRLEAMEPPQNRYAWLLARLELAKNRGDNAAVEAHIAALRRLYPQSVTAVLESADRLTALGKGAQARAVIEGALQAEHASMSELHRLLPLLGAEHVMQPFRKDGAAAIARYEASGRSYEQPQVLVFDYMAVRIFEDGSSVELVHTVQKAQSDEAVDELAEVQVPEGARILKLQTIKADGRRLEPDAIAGKDTISMPSMAIGDYVEFEYISHAQPSEGFPGGYLGDRFYFQSFEIPFDYSHMVVALPKAMKYRIDPRGPAPKTQERLEGELRILDFKVEQSQPLTAEPMSVTAREFLPSVRVGVEASWKRFVESIREVLIDRDLSDPELLALAKSIVGDAAKDDHALRAKRLYGWVVENIENNDDVFSQAALMLRARAGNRARVLHYLLGLSGVPAELALVRTAAGDATDSPMAAADTYEHLLVRLPKGSEPRWIFSAERWAPFGYIPPILRDQPALLLAEGAPRVKVPAGDGQQDSRKVTLDVELQTDGRARIDVVEIQKGAGAIAWRSQLEAIPAAELEHRFEEDYVARLIPGATLARLQVEDAAERLPSITLRYSFDVEVLGRRVADGWALPPILAERLSASYARVPTRTTVQLVADPADSTVLLRVRLPAGSGAPALPESARLTAAIPGRPSFEQKARFEEGILQLERHLTVPLMRVTPKDYPAFVSFCQKVDELEARELIFGGR